MIRDSSANMSASTSKSKDRNRPQDSANFPVPEVLKVRDSQ